MCAINGLITLGQVDRENFAAMTLSMAHRGPDGSGEFFDGSIALGHRRLAIIDLTPGGHQPMEKHGLVLTYNGEIYNYLELKKELQALGHAFHSESDTEVILTAYHQWGADCVKKFNGMWAFAIYDRSRRTVFCSRDRFGVKPFYYFYDGKNFAFASEIKSLLRFNGYSKKVNNATVSKYLISSVVDDGDQTFFSGITRLLPGHNLEVQTQNLKINLHRYYDVSENNTSYGPADLHDILIDAVRLRMRADTPVGSCLSGGLDSSLLVSIASRMPSKGKLNTFTAIPYDRQFDESEYVRKLEADLPIQAHYLEPQKQDFQNALHDVIRLQEEPFMSPSIFMQYFVMQKANQTGLKVLLDGQGADEIFLGYEKYIPSMLFKIFGVSPGAAITSLAEVLKNNANVSMNFLLRVSAKQILKNRLSAQSLSLKAMLNPEFSKDQTYTAVNDCARDIDSYRLSDILSYNLPALLRYEDKNSMHFSIETRLPFLDYRVVDIALKFKPKDLIAHGLTKAPLRSSFDEILPKYISQRRSKFNFNAPKSAMEGLSTAQKRNAGLFFRNLDSTSKLSPIQQWKIQNLLLWNENNF